MVDTANQKVIALFDVDQTLSPARQSIQPDMIETLKQMRAKGVHFGIVSGSDLNKVTEQLGKELVDSAEFCFAENGLYAMKEGQMFSKQSFSEHLGEDKLQKLINFCLKYMANIELPCKR